MALVNLVEKTPPVNTENTIEITKPEFSGVLVDTRYTPQRDILTHLEGSSWIVNYYSQVLDKDNEVKGHHPNKDPLYQPYNLLLGLEILVNTPLGTVQNQSTNEVQSEGMATMYPGVIPNVGDVFIADIGDGKAGVFQITQSEKRSFSKDSAFIIYYKYIREVDQIYIDKLNEAVIEKYHFIKNYIYAGKNPLVLSKDFILIKELEQYANSLIKYYFDVYFNNELSTLLIPEQNNFTYDHFLVKNISKFFNVTEHPNLQKLRTLNLDDDNNFKQISIFDAVSSLDINYFNRCFKKYFIVRSNSFDVNIYFNSIYYAGVDFVVYPETHIKIGNDLINDKRKFNSNQYIKPSSMYLSKGATNEDSNLLSQNNTALNNQPNGEDQKSNLVGGNNNTKSISITNSLFSNTDCTIYSILKEDDIKDLVDIHPIHLDNYYIFSESFYLKKSGMSKLEVLVHLMLERKKLDNVILFELYNNYYKWGDVEKFYYIPFLILLISYSVKHN